MEQPVYFYTNRRINNFFDENVDMTVVKKVQHSRDNSKIRRSETEFFKANTRTKLPNRKKCHMNIFEEIDYASIDLKIYRVFHSKCLHFFSISRNLHVGLFILTNLM